MTIRRFPEDFRVEERLSPEYAAALSPERPPGRAFALYRLTKTSLTTPEAAAMLARALGVRPGAAAWGGLKDKHALTIQHVSVALPSGAEPAEAPGGRGWSAEHLGWALEPMSPAAQCGNLFEIVVRDLSRDAAGMMEERAARLRDPGDPAALLVVNYFGDQRFGSARHGQGFAAPHLIRGDFESALRLLIATPARKDSGKKRQFTRLAAQQWGRWADLVQQLPRCPERAAVEALAAGKTFRDAFAALPYSLQNLCVEAYQSFLWNDTARRLVRSLGDCVITAADPYGDLALPEAGAIPPDWRSLVVPLLGPRTRLDPAWAAAANEALRAEGLSQSDLRIPGLRRPAFDEHPRRLIVAAADFSLEPVQADEASGGRRFKRAVRFVLPAGAFATVVLRALGQ